MNPLTIARTASTAEIKRLATEQARLEGVLRSLGAETTAAPTPRAAKLKRCLRLKDDVTADITSKVVKAVKAHREGASRKNILAYLSRSGYEVGHHFNEPHLNKIVSSLLSSEAAPIRREGSKGTARYFVA